MNIAVDIRHLTRGEQSGVGTYTVALLHALFALDKTNHYLLLSSGTKEAAKHLPLFRYENVTSVHIPIPNRILNGLLLSRIVCLEQFLPNSFSDPVFFFPNINIISLRKTTPFIITLHDLSFEHFPHFFSKKSQLWHRLIRPAYLAKQARAIIVPSKSTARDVEHVYYIAPEKIQTIPHGIDLSFSSVSSSEDQKIKTIYQLPENFILFIGDLDPRKNIQAAIEGVKRYREKTGNDLHFVMAGKGNLTSTDPLPDFVHMLGYIPNEHKATLYRLAAITVFPSIYEGFGFPILESMASGTPVIASYTSSMTEIGADAAMYIDPYNANDIAHAIEQILSSPSLQMDLKTKGFEQVRKFSWKETAERTLEVFEKVEKI